MSLRVSLLLRDDKTTVNDGRRDGVLCPTIQWLQDHLLPKLCKWAEEIQPDGKSSKGSLRLVPLDHYTLLYHRLKQDYGEKLVKVSRCMFLNYHKNSYLDIEAKIKVFLVCEILYPEY